MQPLATEVGDGKYGGIVAVYKWTGSDVYADRSGFQVIHSGNTLPIELARPYIIALMQAHRIP